MAVRAPLNSILTQIKAILDAANTTTASPIDLSSDLLNSKRVRKVLKVNPEMIIPQASMFPLVTCYIPNKDIVSADIAKDQLNAKRRAKIPVSIVGSVWNNNFVSVEQDPADTDINFLMENIELALRSDYNLSINTSTGSCNWQVAKGCQYYTTILSEQTHLRSGVLTLECEVFY